VPVYLAAVSYGRIQPPPRAWLYSPMMGSGESSLSLEGPQ
jgi:hypothetical protein